MKVFIVFSVVTHESYGMDGIYNSLEKAMNSINDVEWVDKTQTKYPSKIVKRTNKLDSSEHPDWFTIEEWEVK